MSAHFEVEQKYQPTAPVCDALPARLRALGFAPSYQKQLTDIYYTDAAHTFIAQRICLRLRATDGVLVSLDYKSAVSQAQQANTHAKQEIELAVTGAPLTTGQALLTALGYQEYVVVDKHRTHYASPQFAGLAVEWDEVAHIGTYIELEALVDGTENISAAEESLRDLAAQLGLTSAMLVGKPYRDLVAAARGIAA